MNSQNYATRCRGQLNALLPKATRPRAIVHWAVHGTEGHSFDYSAKQAWNNCFITQRKLKKPNTNLLAIDCLIGARRRKPVTSHGILVTLNVIGHGIVKNYTTLIPHYVYMGDVTGMV